MKEQNNYKTSVLLPLHLRRYIEDNYSSYSQGIYECVKKDYDRQTNPFDKFIFQMEEEERIEREMLNTIQELNKISIEGNLEERQKADDLKAKFEKKQKEKKDNLKLLLHKIEESQYYKEFAKDLNNGLKDDKRKIQDWAAKFSIEFQADKTFLFNFANFYKLINKSNIKVINHG